MAARFADLDPEYLARLRRHSDERGPREILDTAVRAPLYLGEYWIERLLTVADLVRSTRGVAGDLAEFGSWNGANAVTLANLIRLFEPLSVKRVHAFDTFEGLAEFAPEDGPAAAWNGTHVGDEAELRAAIALHGMERELVVHAGDVRRTLPAMLHERPSTVFSLVYCDLDLYDPTTAVLAAVADRVPPGGLIVFDEYGWPDFPGEELAANEFLAQHAADWDVLALGRQPTLALRRRSGEPWRPPTQHRD
ncbi:TylF/MycF/NovP-related O-methyltransferase [uncultured Amnibacterium sp.]|uniref:TylF/MycF/NovP-related O-methyltransferase n=1 Tax=uncultured Amnibacterium sp. TaxID=1631851 RepID=UPI0035CB2E31